MVVIAWYIHMTELNQFYQTQISGYNRWFKKEVDRYVITIQSYGREPALGGGWANWKPNNIIMYSSHYHLLSHKWARFTKEQWIDAQENEAAIMNDETIGATVEPEGPKELKQRYSPILQELTAKSREDGDPILLESQIWFICSISRTMGETKTVASALQSRQVGRTPKDRAAWWQIWIKGSDETLPDQEGITAWMIQTNNDWSWALESKEQMTA